MKRTVIAIVMLLGLAPLPSASSVVYEQPPLEPQVSTRASSFITPPGAFSFQTFDDFTLTTSQSLTDVHWRGSYFDFISTDQSSAPAANATGFGVAFHADSSNAPGVLLTTYEFAIGDVNETFVGDEVIVGLNNAVFDYDVLLDAPFVALANTKYWLSIYALQPAPELGVPQWGWVGGEGGDSFAFQSGGLVNFDRAFALTVPDATVPEPATLLLVGGGLMAVAGFAARRRGRRASRGGRA